MDIYQLIDNIHLQKLEQLDERVKDTLFTDDHEGLFQLGETLFQFGLVDNALKVFERLFELYPEDADVFAYYIEALVDNNEIDKALTILHQMPKSVSRLMLEADIYQQQGMTEVAIDKVIEARHLSQDDPILTYALSELYYFDGDYLKAAKHYEMLLNDGIDEINNVHIQLRLADSMLQAGDYDDANELYQTIDEKIFTSDDYFKKAISYQKTDQVKSAIEILQQLNEKDPDYMQAYLLLVNLLESERRYEDAILIGQKGILLNEFYKELLVDTGRIMIKMHQEKGAEYLIQALTIDPSYVEASLLLTDYYIQEEDYDAMVQLFGVIDEDDMDPTIMWKLAYSYQQLERDKEAKHLYHEAFQQLNENLDFLKDYYLYTREIGEHQLNEMLYAKIKSIDSTYLEEFEDESY